MGNLFLEKGCSLFISGSGGAANVSSGIKGTYTVIKM